MIEWLISLLSLEFRATKRSELISMQQKGEMKMPQGMTSMSGDMGMSKGMGLNGQGGHLYMQTNEINNTVIHYDRSGNGMLTEVERVATGGAGSGTFKPISGQESAPNAFEGAGSVIVTSDRRFLFTTNGGDNSVSSFAVAEDGRLTLLDRKPTGNPIEGKSGTAKSLAFAPSKGMLYVLHSFGPDHLRLMSVDDKGKLTTRKERYTVNTQDKTDRVPTMAVLSPEGIFQDAKAGSPFYLAFLNGQPDTFVIGYAVGDGCALATIDKNGTISVGELVKIDTSPGLPSELCWLAVSPNDGFVFATNFGYSYISSYRLNGKGLEIARDPACPKVPGDGTARGLNTTVTSGPSDNWVSPDGGFLYQIYGNASKL